MALAIPENMDACGYFTNRSLRNSKEELTGKIICWVGRGKCPKCKKGLMTKPLDPKTGKFKVRSAEYVCGACGHTEEKAAFEKTLSANAIYTCPECGNKGEETVPFARKTYMGVKAIVFTCSKCKASMAVTKKLKDLKKKKPAKGKVAVEEAPDDDDDF